MTQTIPLTHHEILGLVGPFARRGRHVDLAGSDRHARSIVFQPVNHPGAASALPDMHESLKLENPREGLFRLTRTLALPCGLEATLSAEGADPGDLIARIESVPPPSQFRRRGDVLIACSYRRDPTPPAEPVFTRGEARVGPVSLVVTAARSRGDSATVKLIPRAGAPGELPEDLLAVLGWDWGPLQKRRAEWVAELRVGGRPGDQTRRLESRLETTAAHLAATFAHPPAHFHETLLASRWAAAFRRAMPMLLWLGLLSGAFGLSFVRIAPDSFIRMFAWTTPYLLLVAVFSIRPRPRLEIPPLPRRPSATSW